MIRLGNKIGGTSVKSLQSNLMNMIAVLLLVLAGASFFMGSSFVAPRLFPAMKHDYYFDRFRSAETPNTVMKFAQNACGLHSVRFHDKLKNTSNLTSARAYAAIVALDHEGNLSPSLWSKTAAKLLKDMPPSTRRKTLDHLSIGACFHISNHLPVTKEVETRKQSLSKRINTEILRALKDRERTPTDGG